MGQLRWLVKISYKSREFSVYTAATLSLPQPDHGVLRKAQRGDERAFSIIVRAYQIPVYNYVLRMVGDRSLAEDLTQEVFLRVFQGLPRFSLRSKFTTWMFQVTKNRVLDELRATERRARARAGSRTARPAGGLDLGLQAELEPPREHLGQARVPHLALRLFHVVLDAAKARVLRLEVEQEVGRPRVTVTWLSDRPRIEERPHAGEVEVGAAACDAAVELLARLHDPQCDVTVPD